MNSHKIVRPATGPRRQGLFIGAVTRKTRLTLGALLVLVTVVLAGSPAQAALNTWYGLPAAHGGQASAIMTTFHVATYGSGYAAGRVWISNPTSSSLYVQFKPNEGGTWNRLSQNVPRTAAGQGRYYNWSDNFYFNYSGYEFRICKDQLGLDPCGASRKIYG